MSERISCFRASYISVYTRPITNLARVKGESMGGVYTFLLLLKQKI